MTSRKSRPTCKKGTKNCTAEQLPKDHFPQDVEESVDDILANVDSFLDSVYRDLRIEQPRRSSVGNIFRPSSVEDVSADRTFREESAPVVSPSARRNMDAEIERIDRICDDVDQNLRAIGLFMNISSTISISDDLSNTNLTNSPSSTSIINCDVDSNINSQRRGSSPLGSITDQFVDLSNSQTATPEIFRQPVRQSNYDDDDDDVILVSSNIAPVVDLCTPLGHMGIPRAIHSANPGQLHRRRLHCNDMDRTDTCCGVPSSPRRRRTESSFVQSEGYNTSYTEKTSSTTTDRPQFTCPVCMERCLQRQPTSTVCGHVFCKKCIEQAIALTRKCPICNKKITKKQTFRIYV